VTRDFRTKALRLLLALVLLLGQASAQVHAYSHLDSTSGPVDPTGLHTQLCSHCLSSAALLSAVGSSNHLVVPAFGQEVRISSLLAVAPFAQPCQHGFQSRAPPVFL